MKVPSPFGGGKFQRYVAALINADREPIRLIQRQKAKEEDRLKLVKVFEAKVRKIPEAFAKLQDFRAFRELKAAWPTKDLMGVMLDKNLAQPGDYQIEVDQLAGRHSMISNGYEKPTSQVGVGYFTYELPNGDTKSVWIGPGDNTLQGLVNTINQERHLGIQASLINDGSDSGHPWRVVVHGKKTGMNNDIQFPDFYFLDGDLRFRNDDERSAQNAIIKFDGFKIMSQSNNVKLLPGVTLNLKQAKPGREFTLSIKEDYEKIAGKVKALVDALNGALQFVNQQNHLDAHSDTSRTLGGDTSLFTIESRIRRFIFENFHIDPDDSNAVMNLSDIGIVFQSNGLLSFNKNKFKKALSDDFQGVANFFTGKGNFVDQLRFLTNGFLQPGNGAITIRATGIRERMKEMDQEIDSQERMLSMKAKNLKQKFARLQGLLDGMHQQQAYMTQAFGAPSAIPGMK